jgi:hypothetical protein
MLAMIEAGITTQMSSHRARANLSFHSGSPGSASRYSSPCCPLRSILTRCPSPGIPHLGFCASECFSHQKGLGPLYGRRPLAEAALT